MRLVIPVSATPILHTGIADSVGQHGRHCGTLLRHAAALAMSLEPFAGGKAGAAAVRRERETCKPAEDALRTCGLGRNTMTLAHMAAGHRTGCLAKVTVTQR